MKTVFKIFLALFFIPLFLIGITLSNLRFQLLNANFWLTTLTENNVYENLASAFKKSSEFKIEEGGGSKKEAKVLTDLITPENIKDVASKNLIYLLDYVNGKSREFDVYVPIGKLPKELLPTNFGAKPDTIPLKQLLRSFNIQNVSESQILALSMVGPWSTAILIGDAILLVVISLLFFLFTDRGKSFWAMGVALILSGIFSLAGFAFGEAVRQSMIHEWPKNVEASQQVLGTFAPFILEKIILVWLIVGLAAILLGVLLFFLKRPVYNIGK